MSAAAGWIPQAPSCRGSLGVHAPRGPLEDPRDCHTSRARKERGFRHTPRYDAGQACGLARNDTSVFKFEMVLLLDGWGAVGCEVFAGRNLAPSSKSRAARRFFSFSGERKERGRKGRCSGAKEDFGASRPSPPWCAYRGISPGGEAFSAAAGRDGEEFMQTLQMVLYFRTLKC